MKRLALLFGLLILGLLNCSSLMATSRIELSPLFTNNMVIQREKPVVIWGKTAPGNQVLISLNHVQKSTQSDADGYFETSFEPLPVGGPYELQVSANDTLVKINNILSGDVWLCSGQSNMAWQLKDEMFASEEAANSDYPDLRMIRLPTNSALEPVTNDTRPTRWLVSGSTSAKLFSAVGYYFGRTIHNGIKVPVGLIATFWGGSTIETWISEDGLKSFNEFKSFFDELHSGTVSLADYEQRAADSLLARQKGTLVDAFAPLAIQHFPSLTYNGMVAPIKKFPMKGVIWYQGENNVARAWQYRALFPALINDWRVQFNNADMPFYYVQLPGFGLIRNYPHESQWAELRDAQNQALAMNNTKMAVTIDVGSTDDIHPKNKRTVGYRLANLALRNIYGQTSVNSEFPQLKAYTVDGGSIVCEFDNVGTGLTVQGGELTEFTISGENGVFNRAKAEIIAPNKIRLSSDYVPVPTAVRYAWSYFPINGLVYNSDNLPLGTFRTDTFRVSTQPAPVSAGDTITMKTAKPKDSKITLLVSVSGSGEFDVDWGDGNLVPVNGVSTATGKPTTITGTTMTDQAEIKVYTRSSSILYLNCASNELTVLDVSRALQLLYLRAYTNKLTSIDLSKNKELQTLYLYSNSLTTLDVSNNQKLVDLQFGTNKISNFVGLDKLTALRTLSAMVNPLGELELKYNPVLQLINLRNCGLTSLDLSKVTNSLSLVEVQNGGHVNANHFTACGLDSLYLSLPDRTGMTAGVVRVINSVANPLFNDGDGSNKNIAADKNWVVKSYNKETLTGDGGGCIISSGIDNAASMDNNLVISPNPVKNKVTIHIPTLARGHRLMIFDSLGKKVRDIAVRATQKSVLLDVSSFAQGIYLVHIERYSNKLIKK